MPYRTNWEPDGIIWEYYGHVTSKDISESNSEFFHDMRSKNARYQIVDTSETEILEWPEMDIVETSANDVGASRVVEKIKLAFVIRKEEIYRKIQKYIEISRKLDTNWEFRIFDNIEDARSWVKQEEQK